MFKEVIINRNISSSLVNCWGMELRVDGVDSTNSKRKKKDSHSVYSLNYCGGGVSGGGRWLYE